MDYEIISLISKNDYTTVWLASTPVNDEPVIVKELTDGDAHIVERISTISSTHIPKILEIETNPSDSTLLVMEEYIDGVPIDTYIEDNHLSTDDIVPLIIQICDGLDMLHSQNPPIIHRDIKPANILVDSTGTVKIIDFNASREYKIDKSKDTRALGTLEYAPPEQYGHSQTDARSDIYALGIVINELFKDKDTPDYIKNIISKSTQFSPDSRYMTIGELKSDLTFKKGGKRKLTTFIPIAIAACILVIALIVGQINTSKSDTNPTVQARETTIDTYDYENDAQVPWTFYYWIGHSDLTPLRITNTSIQGLSVEQIQVKGEDSIYTDTIAKKYWRQDEHGYIHIGDAYLDKLNPDIIYSFMIDCGESRISFQVCCVNDLRKTTLAFPVSNPGFVEYLTSEPGNVFLYFLNTFGRRLQRLIDADTGEDVDTSLYDYDESEQSIIFHEDIFKNVPPQEFINYIFVFEPMDEIKDPPTEVGPGITFCVFEHPYVAPEFDKTGYILTDTNEDLTIDLTWNDGKDHLEFIEIAGDEGSEKLDEADYELSDDAVTIRSAVLKKLKSGNYTLSMEFGVVARSVKLQIN